MHLFNKICFLTCFYICVCVKKERHLHRYPKNNLFTLKN